MALKSKTKIFIKKTDSEDDDLYGMRQAFEVPKLPEDFDPNVPPSSGEEYLQHVLFESKKYAPVSIAKRLTLSAEDALCDPSQVPIKHKIFSSSLSPSPEWEEEQINKFGKLRNKIHDLKMSNKKVDNPIKIPAVDADPQHWQQFISTNEPLLSLVLCLRQESLGVLLAVLQKSVGTPDFKDNHGKWIYAICVCLEHPLSREACGELRDIARKYSTIRRKMTDPKDKVVVMANLFITLVVKYFGQRDLCEGE